MILCGDSAGGNLVLALLSHILHPHDSVTPLKLREPLLGAAVVSPWGDFRTDSASYTNNALRDCINAPVLQKWSAYFMGDAKGDSYNQPFRAPSGWWKDIDSILQNLLITVGTHEVILDAVEAFAETIKVCLCNCHPTAAGLMFFGA